MAITHACFQEVFTRQFNLFTIFLFPNHTTRLLLCLSLLSHLITYHFVFSTHIFCLLFVLNCNLTFNLTTKMRTLGEKFVRHPARCLTSISLIFPTSLWIHWRTYLVSLCTPQTVWQSLELPGSPASLRQPAGPCLRQAPHRSGFPTPTFCISQTGSLATSHSTSELIPHLSAF